MRLGSPYSAYLLAMNRLPILIAAEKISMVWTDIIRVIPR